MRRNWRLDKYRKAEQSTLDGVTFSMKDKLATLRHDREEIMMELSRIEHYLICQECQFELKLNVERYWGRHCPFYLNLIYDIEEAPPASHYNIGSYGNSSEDTLRFIMDRLKWGKNFLQKEAEPLFFEIRRLQNHRLF